MAIHKAATWPWAARHTFGTLNNKGIYSVTVGYTETQKAVAAGTATAVMASTAGANSSQTITTGLTDPDVPRVLLLTVGGTASNVQAGSVVVTGTNVEGKTITEAFPVTFAGTGTYNGTKAFRTVDSVVIPGQVGTGGTFSLGTRDILGVNHRLWQNNTTVKVYTKATTYGALTLQAAPTVAPNVSEVEKNLITPNVAPNGSLIFTIWYSYDYWALAPINDNPEYSTTTSTSSTSSSTSTTTITTSTSSSTSISTSTTTSVSVTTSTSSSTSTSLSTSTSTTTTP